MIPHADYTVDRSRPPKTHRTTWQRHRRPPVIVDVGFRDVTPVRTAQARMTAAEAAIWSGALCFVAGAACGAGGVLGAICALVGL